MAHARDPTARDTHTSARQQTEAIVRAHLAGLYSPGDGGAALSDDVTLTIMATGEVKHGRAAVVSLLDYLHQQAFAAPPSVTSLVTAADRAMIEADFTGVHTGEFAGIAPTGRRVHVAYMAAYDLNTEGISAVRLYLPLDSLVRQLRDP
jgi:predicted ester cyclase